MKTRKVIGQIAALLFFLAFIYSLLAYGQGQKKQQHEQNLRLLDRMLVTQMLKTLDFELEPLPIEGQYRLYYPGDRSQLVLCTGEGQAQCWLYDVTNSAESRVVNK